MTAQIKWLPKNDSKLRKLAARTFQTNGSSTHPRLRQALSILKNSGLPSEAPMAFRMMIWEIMRTQTKLNQLEISMDKKMHQVTKRMKTAEHDVRKGKKKAAVKVLRKAEKKNEKLVRIDRKVRDPMIKKCKKMMKKGKR